MKLLIVRIGALGDVLHTLPAVAALRFAQPEWQIDWVVDPRWAPVLVNGDGSSASVHRLHLAETKLWTNAPLSRQTVASLRALRRAVRAERYDLVVDMQGTIRSAVIGRLAAAPVRAGYADPRESAATLFYTRSLERRGAHVVEQGAALLGEATGVTLKPMAAEIPHEAWADHWAAEEAATGKLCLLAPGAGWGAKQWPMTNFAALAVELRARGFDVVVNAARKDNELAAGIVEASGGTARTVVCNVTGLIALTRRASVVVGGDSGPTHLAAALGVPVVALFGPTDPDRNGPWGPGPVRILRHETSTTTYKRNTESDSGLSRIGVLEVLGAALEIVI